MKILVLCAGYPDLYGGITLNYVHTRNIAYLSHGVDVVVLSFQASSGYVKDGIKVISLSEFKNDSNKEYDILVCHAANLKNHYCFLKRYDKLFKRIIFFYHGHEVMKLTTEYPKEYFFKKKNYLYSVFIPAYDFLKLRLWGRYIKKNIQKLQLVFVSEWMYDVFMRNLKIDRSIISDRVSIIYNSVSKNYEIYNYEPNLPKKYDYVTIRGVIDTSKFAIDVVNKLAFENPDKKFLIVGKGEFFKYYEKAPNIERIERFLNQNEIITILNESKYALMPTRVDAQGVMACEMATFGIPLITSDIPVCRYVLDGFSNVAFINNEPNGNELLKLSSSIAPELSRKNDRFFEKNTIGKEIELLQMFMSK